MLPRPLLHQPPLHQGDRGSHGPAEPPGRYLHIGRRLPVHVVGDDEIPVEEGVCTGWARALLVHAGLEGHAALGEATEDLTQLGRGLLTVPCPREGGKAPQQEPAGGTWAGQLPSGMPWPS